MPGLLPKLRISRKLFNILREGSEHMMSRKKHYSGAFAPKRTHDIPHTAMRPAYGSERGSVTVFIVTIFSSLVLLAGLVLDGGYVLAAKMRAISVADGAARAGAQAIQGNLYREKGEVQFDATAATTAGNAYLDASGVNGSVEVQNGIVIAHAQVPQAMAILGVVGVGPFLLTGEGRSRLIQGVNGPAS